MCYNIAMPVQGADTGYGSSEFSATVNIIWHAQKSSLISLLFKRRYINI